MCCWFDGICIQTASEWHSASPRWRWRFPTFSHFSRIRSSFSLYSAQILIPPFKELLHPAYLLFGHWQPYPHLFSALHSRCPALRRCTCACVCGRATQFHLPVSAINNLTHPGDHSCGQRTLTKCQARCHPFKTLF